MTAPSEKHTEDANTLFRTTPLEMVRRKGNSLLLSPSDWVTVSEHSPEPDANHVRGMTPSGLSPQPNPHVWSQNNELPQIDGLFELRECIGHGGFGDVYKAFDLVLRRDVAIKTLRTENEKFSMRYRFITEANVAAYLEHPNIIPVHGLYTDEQNQLHRVEKLIKGDDFKAIIESQIEDYNKKSRREIAKEEREHLITRLEIFLKVCDAIDYAHDKNILHNDIKLENIMVGEFSEVYVTDWGLAETRDSETRRREKKQVGTLLYMPPEIFGNGIYDSRSDIYSLGVMLFYILFLVPPFPNVVSQQGLIELKAKGLVSPQEHLFGVKIPRPLHSIVRKAIATQPANRYQTVAKLAGDIRLFLRGKPVTPTFCQKIEKWFTF